MPRDERREQLMDVALELILEVGYQGVSIGAVAERAGFSRPVVYGVFDDLEDLLVTLLDRQQNRAMAQLLEVLMRAERPIDVGEVVRGMAAKVAENPTTWRPVLLSPADVPERVRERIEQGRTQIREQFGLMFAGRLREHPDARFDADVLGHLTLGMAEYVGRMLLEHPGRLDVDRVSETMKALLTLGGS